MKNTDKTLVMFMFGALLIAIVSAFGFSNYELANFSILFSIFLRLCLD